MLPRRRRGSRRRSKSDGRHFGYGESSARWVSWVRDSIVQGLQLSISKDDEATEKEIMKITKGDGEFSLFSLFSFSHRIFYLRARSGEPFALRHSEVFSSEIFSSFHQRGTLTVDAQELGRNQARPWTPPRFRSLTLCGEGPVLRHRLRFPQTTNLNSQTPNHYLSNPVGNRSRWTRALRPPRHLLPTSSCRRPPHESPSCRQCGRARCWSCRRGCGRRTRCPSTGAVPSTPAGSTSCPGVASGRDVLGASRSAVICRQPAAGCGGCEVAPHEDDGVAKN